MDSQFNVVFTGELKPGTDRETFIQAFSQRFQVSEEKAAELLDAGKPVNMKSAVDKEVAEKFRAVLDELGMMIQLEPLPSKRAVFEASEPSTAQQPAPAKSAEQSEATNPYQAPQANLHQAEEEGEMTGPVSVPAGNGIAWIGSAFSDHFKQSPGAWIGAIVVLVLLSMAMQAIPLLGPLAYSLLSPVFAGGLMLGAHAQHEGEDFTFNHLFSGFQQSTGQLILLGALYLVAMIVMVVIVGVLIGGSMAMFGDMGDPEAIDAVMQDSPAFLLMILVSLLLFLPVLMAYWFAPALIVLNGVSALTAAQMSFMGCLKNLLPFLLYGIVMLVLMFIAAIPLFLGYLVLLPLITASIYTAYRDIYYPEA
jgi:uncharacterized membrane protein